MSCKTHRKIAISLAYTTIYQHIPRFSTYHKDVTLGTLLPNDILWIVITKLLPNYCETTWIYLSGHLLFDWCFSMTESNIRIHLLFACSIIFSTYFPTRNWALFTSRNFLSLVLTAVNTTYQNLSFSDNHEKNSSWV